MNHDIKHEEKQNKALRFLASEMGKHIAKEMEIILADEPAPVDVDAISVIDTGDDVPAISAVKA